MRLQLGDPHSRIPDIIFGIGVLILFGSLVLGFMTAYKLGKLVPVISEVTSVEKYIAANNKIYFYTHVGYEFEDQKFSDILPDLTWKVYAPGEKVKIQIEEDHPQEIVSDPLPAFLITAFLFIFGAIFYFAGQSLKNKRQNVRNLLKEHISHELY